MDCSKKVSEDQHQTLEDLELFGIEDCRPEVDTSAFEELFSKETPNKSYKPLNVYKFQAVPSKRNTPEVKSNFAQGLRIFSSLLTVLFVVYIFKMIIS